MYVIKAFYDYEEDRVIFKGCTGSFPGHSVMVGGEEQGMTIQVESTSKDGLIIKNDRYGALPCMYYQDKNRIIISDSIETFIDAGLSLTIDYEALAFVIHFETMVESDTIFKEVKQLLPNSILTWRGYKIDIKDNGYPLIYDENIPTVKQAVDSYRELFTQSMQRRLPHKDFLLPLSGGCDSRHILLELDSLGYKPNYVIGSQKEVLSSYVSDDVTYAEQLADRVGVPYKFISSYGNIISKHVRLTRESNMASTIHGWLEPLYGHLNKYSYFSYDGIFGDYLTKMGDDDVFQKTIERDFKTVDPSVLIERYPLKLNEGTIKNHLNPLFYEKVKFANIRDRAMEVFITRFKDCVRPFTSSLMAVRVRRNISLMPFKLMTIPCHTPFMDYQLHDYFMSIPSDVLMKLGNTSKFHEYAIRKIYPKYKDVPYHSDSTRKPGTLKLSATTMCEYISIVNNLDRFNLISKKYAISYAIYTGMKVKPNCFMKNVEYLALSLTKLLENSNVEGG